MNWVSVSISLATRHAIEKVKTKKNGKAMYTLKIEKIKTKKLKSYLQLKKQKLKIGKSKN